MSSNISKRAHETLALECPLLTMLSDVTSRLEHPEFNPNGALNLGLAHNDLLSGMVIEKTRACVEVKPTDLDYGSPEGSAHLRRLLQVFLTKYFKPHYPLQETHILTQTGAGASVNHLIMSTGDVGEYCMVPSPYYGAFDVDISVHTGVKIYEVYPHSLENMSVDGKELDRAYQEAKCQGKSITNLIVTNPSNPLGRCYSRQDLVTYLEFASKYKIHIIFDEIYALSSYSHIIDTSKLDPFISVLSLCYKDYINPSLVHVIYGMSKDFAMNGFRVGFIIDQFNDPVRRTLKRSAAFSYTSTITDRMLCNMFTDEKWIDGYLMTNRYVLANSYTKATDFLKAHDIQFLSAQAGPFFMIDIRPIIRRLHDRDATVADERRIWLRMVDHGVYLAPSFAFHFKTPGFFRLTFALPWNRLENGLNIIIKSLNED